VLNLFQPPVVSMGGICFSGTSWSEARNNHLTLQRSN